MSAEMEAQLLAGLLRAHGLFATVLLDYTGGGLPPHVEAARVVVRRWDPAVARDVLLAAGVDLG